MKQTSVRLMRKMYLINVTPGVRYLNNAVLVERIINTTCSLAEEVAIEVDWSGFAGLIPVTRDPPQDGTILTHSMPEAVITFAALEIAVKVTVVRITSN